MTLLRFLNTLFIPMLTRWEVILAYVSDRQTSASHNHDDSKCINEAILVDRPSAFEKTSIMALVELTANAFAFSSAIVCVDSTHKIYIFRCAPTKNIEWSTTFVYHYTHVEYTTVS